MLQPGGWPKVTFLDAFAGPGRYLEGEEGSPNFWSNDADLHWPVSGENGWEPGAVTYYYDGRKVARITTGVTGKPMYLAFQNTQGNYGKGEVGGPTVPDVYRIDYVRVFTH